MAPHETPHHEMAPADEKSWYSEWDRRLKCWWISLPRPTQGSLGGCIGALALHLGARLEQTLGERPPPAAELSGRCEWLESAALDQLRLPDFPATAGIRFSLPLLPALLPALERLQEQSGARSYQGGAHIQLTTLPRILPRAERAHSSQIPELSMRSGASGHVSGAHSARARIHTEALALGTGVGASVAIVLVAVRLCLGRRTGTSKCTSSRQSLAS